MRRAIIAGLPLGHGLERGFEIAFGVDQEVRGSDDDIAFRDAFPDFDVARTAAADLDRARLEAPLALVDDDEPAVSAVDHGILGHCQYGLIAAGLDLRLHIHVGQQQHVVVRQLDTHGNRAGGRHEVRIDQCDLALEGFVWKAAHAHRDRLARGHAAEIALGNVDQGPYRGMIRDAEQYLAWHYPHAGDHVALEHDTVARGRPGEGQRDLAVALDIVHERWRRRQVQETLLGAAKRLGVALEARYRKYRKIIRGRGGDQGAVEPHERLALAHHGAGGDVLDGVDERLGAQRDHRNAPFVELDGAGRADRHGYDVTLRGFGLDAEALDLAGRHLDGAVVIVAFIDRDVVHPHGILLRRGRDIRQSHRIAVVANFLAAWRGRDIARGFCRHVEAEVFTRQHRAVRSAVRRLHGIGRIERLAVGIAVIDNRTARKL